MGKVTKLKVINVKKIGITGSIGTGKSFVSKLIQDAGYIVIDADIVAREILGPEFSTLSEIEAEFGSRVINEYGTLNRAKLGEIVFQNKVKLAKLNSITHPKINERISELCDTAKKSGAQVVFIDIPLLFENKLESTVDKIIVVIADEKTQLERVIKRDNLSEEDALKRINSQIPISQKASLGDFIIHNSGARDETISQLEKVLEEII